MQKDSRAIEWFVPVSIVELVERGEVKAPIRCTQDLVVTMAKERQLDRDVVIYHVPRGRKVV